MAQSKKRTKQVQQMVDEVNRMLKEQKVNFDTKYADGIAQNYFGVMTNLLLWVGCYKGFNEFHEKRITDENGNVKVFDAYCDKDTPTEERYIQLY